MEWRSGQNLNIYCFCEHYHACCQFDVVLSTSEMKWKCGTTSNHKQHHCTSIEHWWIDYLAIRRRKQTFTSKMFELINNKNNTNKNKKVQYKSMKSNLHLSIYFFDDDVVIDVVVVVIDDYHFFSTNFWMSQCTKPINKVWMENLVAKESIDLLITLENKIKNVLLLSLSWIVQCCFKWKMFNVRIKNRFSKRCFSWH